MPRHHEADFGRATDAQLTSAAETLQKVLRLLDALDGPAYNLVLHTAPLRERVDETYHWHWEIHPRLREIGGLELGTGLPVNPDQPRGRGRGAPGGGGQSDPPHPSGMGRDDDADPHGSRRIVTANAGGPSQVREASAIPAPPTNDRPAAPGDARGRAGGSLLIRNAAQRRPRAVTRDRATARTVVEELFRLHSGEIYAYLARMLRDDELAADLAQETFVKAYRAYETLEDPARARAWLYQIASRTALDELRRRRIVRFIPWTGESRGSDRSAEDAAMHGRLSAEMERALDADPGTPAQRADHG